MTESILDWSQTQSHILTGGGILNSYFVPGRDFKDPEDLPHYLLRTNAAWSTFDEWINENKRSNVIVGVWLRTIFAGGWKESGSSDTEAFNFQTPSIFIDLRIPSSRRLVLQANCKSLTQYSINELQILSRQHCFCGYSLLEPEKSSNKPSVFTRHHAIDWNYHPGFPRSRPNRWSAIVSDDGSSYKEYSVARDEYDIPVYYERWQRIPGDKSGQKYLVLRLETFDDDAPEEGEKRARVEVIVVIGEHFAYVRDRPWPMPAFNGATGPGGPALVDFALGLSGDGSSIRSANDPVKPSSQEGRLMAELYLDLEGSCGRLHPSYLDDFHNPDETEGCNNNGHHATNDWIISRSTHPWREGEYLWSYGAGESYSAPPKLIWLSDGARVSCGGLEWRGRWKLMECNMSIVELQRLFERCGPQSML